MAAIFGDINDKYIASISGHKGSRSKQKATIQIEVIGVLIRSPLGADSEMQTIREAMEHVLPAGARVRNLRRAT